MEVSTPKSSESSFSEEEIQLSISPGRDKYSQKLIQKTKKPEIQDNFYEVDLSHVNQNEFEVVRNLNFIKISSYF